MNVYVREVGDHPHRHGQLLKSRFRLRAVWVTLMRYFMRERCHQPVDGL
jgi:hypothetical protein